jgi:hypothetical protein
MNTANKTYSVIKITNKADTVPYYLEIVTLEQIYAYFFNWHAHQETALVTEIIAWFADKRGWTWQEIS